MTFVRGGLAALAVLAALDALWLGFIGRAFYKIRLGPMLLEQPVWWAAIVFYFLHAAGVAIFPAMLAGGSLSSAALYGALFGLCTYTTYDFGNLATLRGWSIAVTVVDLVWGTAVTAIAVLAAAWAAR